MKCLIKTKLYVVCNIIIVVHIDGLVQDCINFIDNALVLLQSYAKPSTYKEQNIVITSTWTARTV